MQGRNPLTGQGGLGHRILLLLLLGFSAVLLRTPTPAAAAEPLEVLRAGWNGVVASGTWSPIRVRVTGGASDARARVEVVLKNRFHTSALATPVVYPVGAFGQEVALPAGVTKELTLWALIEGDMSGTVRLVENGRVFAEQEVKFDPTRGPNWPLIAVLAESPTVARGISQVEIPYQGLPIPLGAIALTAPEIPTTAEYLSGLSGLVIQGNAATGLTDEQRRTLQEWIAAGGNLVLLGGPDLAKTLSALPDGVVSVEVSAVDPASDLSGFARWAKSTRSEGLIGPLAQFRAQRGSPLAGTAEHPLVWRIGIGRGTVTLLAADPALQPLASWADSPLLFHQALEPALARLASDEKYGLAMAPGSGAMSLQDAVEALPPTVYPDWQTVAKILAGFSLLAGPIGAVALGRLRRRHLIWVIVPGLAVALSAGLYLGGVVIGGRDVIENVVAHVRIDPATGRVQEDLAAGFFAPTHADLTVTVPGDTPTRVLGLANGPRGWITDPSALLPAEPPYAVLSGRETRVEFHGGQWGMRSIGLRRTHALDQVGRLNTRVILEGGLIKGTIRNDTRYHLEDTAIVVGQSLLRLGDLAPGQSVPVSLDSTPPALIRGGFRSLSLQLFGRAMGEAGGSSSRVGIAKPGAMVASAPAPASMVYPAPVYVDQDLILPPDPEVQRRARLMDSVMEQSMKYGPIMPGPSPQRLTFVAFTRAALGADLPRAEDYPIHALTLIEQPLILDLPPGPFSIPAALTPVEVVSTQASRGLGGGGNGIISWIELQGGAIVFGYQPPLPPAGQVDALILTTQQLGNMIPLAQSGNAPIGPNLAPTPAEDGVYAVYNWPSAGWEVIPGGKDQIRLERAASFVGPDGQIQVRISAPADQMLRFTVPEVTVEGRVGA